MLLTSGKEILFLYVDAPLSRNATGILFTGEHSERHRSMARRFSVYIDIESKETIKQTNNQTITTTTTRNKTKIPWASWYTSVKV